jgi:hypothetical protein
MTLDAPRLVAPVDSEDAAAMSPKSSVDVTFANMPITRKAGAFTPASLFQN